jgi:predicted MFS family arabinose efflux permease
VSLFASAFFLGQSLGVVLAAALLARSGATMVFIAAAAITPVLGTVFARRIRQQHRRLQTAQAS